MNGEIMNRGRIVGMIESGKSIRSVAREMGISKQKVQRWFRRYQESGDLSDGNRSGRPRITTLERDREIVNYVKENPLINLRIVKENLGEQASTFTISRRLKEHGIKHHIPAVKELLSQNNKESRLAFALQYVDKDEEFWGKVIFSDERTFASSTHGTLHCYRTINTRYEENHIFDARRSGHTSVNFWGWMNMNCLGELIEIEGKFNAEKYVELLDEVMLPSVKSVFAEKMIFVQDNCPVHTAGIVQQWFKDHEEEIEILQWPSKGCDMNPIENLWGHIVNSWSFEQDRSKANLINNTKSSWEIIRRSPVMLYNYSASMPNRLREVIEARGGWSRY